MEPARQAVHEAPVMVERPPCFGIVEGIIRTDLCCSGESTHKTGFLAVDQRMGPTMPGPSFALNEAEQINEQCNLAHVMHNVLEPPPSDNLLPIDLADRVVAHQTRLVRPISPWLLVVHDVRDFIIVRSGAVLFDVIAPRFQGTHFVIRKD